MSEELTWRIDRLRILREERGWSQRELGRRAGIAETLIAKFERNLSSPSPDALRQLAEALKVSADYLLGGTDDPRRYIVDDKDMSEDERAVLEAFRRDGWRGVIRLGADRIPSYPPPE